MRCVIMGVLLGVIYFITACGGGSGTGTTTTESVTPVPETTAAAEPAVNLPALADLPRITADAGTTYLTGAEYRDDFLHAYVHTQDDQAVYTAPGTTPADSAFAVYAFNLDGLHGETCIHLDISYTGLELPADTLWVGVSNWDGLTWDWYPAALNHYAIIDSSQPYVRDDDKACYVVVLLNGIQTSVILDQIHFGDIPQLMPEITSVTPTSLIANVSTTFTCEATGYQPYNYYWDFGDCMDPATSGDASPTATPLLPGEYDCSLTVTNRYGGCKYPFNVSIEPQCTVWAHLVGGESNHTPLKCMTDSAGNLYMLDESSSLDNTDVSTFDLYKFTPEGEVLWAYTYDTLLTGGGDWNLFGMVISSTNDCYISSRIYPTDAEPDAWNKGTLLKLDSNGSICWHRRNEFEAPVGLGSLAISPDDVIYTCGSSNRPNEHVDICLLRIEPDGEMTYQTHIIWDHDSQGSKPAIDSEGNVYLSGYLYVYQPVGATIHFIAKFDPYCSPVMFKRLDGWSGLDYNEVTDEIWAVNSQFIQAFDLNCESKWRINTYPLLKSGHMFSLDPAGGAIFCAGLTAGRCRIARINSHGELDWARSWHCDYEDIVGFTSCVAAQSGEYYVCAESRSSEGSWQDITSLVEITPCDAVPNTLVDVETYNTQYTMVDEPCSRAETAYIVDEQKTYDLNLVMRISP